MMSFEIDGGSFRDPSGRVYSNGEEIIRVVSPNAAEEYAYARDCGFILSLIEKEQLVNTQEIDLQNLEVVVPKNGIVLRHEKIPFISYPYEWSFSLLKAAALLTLDLHIEALKFGITMSDATAYNVQFCGIKPIFIDVLSFRRYREGEVWIGHKQFCEQFLNPLLLRSIFGVPHNAWFRGNLEGIETSHLSRLIPCWKNFSFNIFSNVTLQEKIQAKATLEKEKFVSAANRVKLPKNRFESMLMGMRRWVSRLKAKDTGLSLWQNYENQTSYENTEHEAKRKFISEFCSKIKPSTLWDIGCNAGEYSEVALSGGAGRVIGFDVDHNAIELAYNRAKEKGLNFLPLYQDFANPSPQQGWANVERKSLEVRGGADGLIALAFIHHLAIGRNIPLEILLNWIVSLSPYGVIEFVQKSDPKVKELLSFREDIFSDYNQKNFENHLSLRARIIQSEIVSSSGRILYFYESQCR